jgi:hypothetical protein
MRHILLLLTICGFVHAADYYPANSRFGIYGVGTYQGIVGGIPDRSGNTTFNATSSPYNMSTGGTAAANATALHAAIDAAVAAGTGNRVYIPAGTYQINSILLNQDRSNVTIFGAGPGVTILQVNSASNINIEASQNYGSVFNNQSTLTAYSRGSSSVTIADATGWLTFSGEANRVIGRISFPNESATPVVSSGGTLRTRSISVLVTGRTGTTLTLSQPLPSDFANAPSATIELGVQIPTNTRGIGIESLSIDADDLGTSSFPMQIRYANNCWLYDVHITGHNSYGITLYDGVNIEIRKCRVGAAAGGGSNRAGINMSNSSYCAIVDSVIVQNSPIIEFFGANTNNVIAYNYLGTGYVNINHAPHPSHNLIEGNVGWFAMSDGYFGGSSEDTIYRNYWKSGIVAVLKRFTRYTNVVGNIAGTSTWSVSGESAPTTDYTEHWGTPNIGNNDYQGGTWSLAGSDYALDWDVANNRPYVWTGTLTTRTSDTQGVITIDTGQITSFNTAIANALTNQRAIYATGGENAGYPVTINSVSGNDLTLTTNSSSYILPVLNATVGISPSQYGFQERDEDAAGTAIRKANFYYVTGNIPAGEALGSDTLVDSYSHTSKPSWFGSLNWPPYNPSSPPTTDAVASVAIPAGWREINGNENYLGSATTYAPGRLRMLRR